MRKFYLLLLAMAGTLVTYAQNVTVNPGGGSYATLASAFSAINSGTHTGAITVDIINSTTETATATLNASGSGSASYTSILIRPVGAQSVSGAISAGSPMIDFSGADNVTIDGLNTGGNSLTISNTTASATSGTSTIRFIGGATNNTITNCTIQGSSSASVATNGGTIFFSTDGVTANGNDNNTISNNNIGPAGANLPSKAIVGNGSTTTTAIGNSGISITNNNIFDYFGAAVTSAGIATNGGCNSWTINGNRFYQTGTRTWTTGALHTPINIQGATATSGAQGFTITNNIIGYANNTQTGTYTLTGAGSGAKFMGILYNGIATGTNSTVSTNTVAGISMTGVTGSGTTTTSPFTAILLQEGNFISNGNIIGSQTANGSLTFSTTTTSSTDIYGIHNFTSNAWTSNNNVVGGISATNLGASGTFLLMGIRCFTGTTVNWNASGNTIGGTIANSIQLTATGTSSQVIGMFTSNAPANLTSNTIRNLTTNIGTGTTTAASVIGIAITTATPSHTLSQNTISSLTNTNTTAASVVTGIQLSANTATVQRNFIYDLTVATNSTAAEVNGIRVAAGTSTFRNNMIAIGAGITNAIGTGSTTGGVYGINEAAGVNNFYHNSIYIGGAPTAGVGPSFAFNSTVTSSTRAFRDNIFVNARSNGGATGKNYIIRVGGSGANPLGLTINNNIYYGNGTGAVFGFFNAADVADLNAWKLAVGQDANSFYLDPQFLSPTASVPDLHLNPSVITPAEANGGDVGVTDDFDGQTRSGLTPVDIGADAGNFLGTDLNPPTIVYTALGNTSLTTNRNLSATITDASGVPTSGIGLPVIYFRKGISGPYASVQATSAGADVYNFIIDYSLVTGGSVTAGDVIQYYVVAQDAATTPNVTSNPSAGASGYTFNPPAAGTPPTANSYTIVPSYSGVYTVPGSFTSLTNTGGIFEAINNGVVSGNVDIQITADLLSETGTVALNSTTEEPVGGNFNIRIYPTGAARTISGSTASNALIRLRGANRVTIDGSIGGGANDRSLTITNTSTTSPTVVLFGSVGTTPVTNDAIRNCVVINGVNTSSAVVISDATTLGTAGYFSNITVHNNNIQKAFVGVFATGGTTPANGSNVVMTNNTLTTSGANAIRVVGLYAQGVNGATISNNTIGNFDATNNENDAAIWLATGTLNCTVANNTISNMSYTGTGTFGPYGINITSAVANTNHIITDNIISNCSGNGTPTSGAAVTGINVSGATSDLTIQRNKITGMRSINTGTYGAYGMDLNGGNNIVVKNNFVSDITADMTGGSAFSTTFGIFGIRVNTGTGHKVYNNSVNLYGLRPGTATASLLSAAFAITTTASTGVDVRNNIFANNITGGTTSVANVAMFLPSSGTSAMNLTLNSNAYYFGTDAARQGIGQAGTTAGTNFYTTLAAQTAYSTTLSPAGTNDNVSSALNSAVPFISATDLHIAPSAGCTTSGKGINIPAVTDDIDRNSRNTLPFIGAHEAYEPATGSTTLFSTTPGTANRTYTINGATDYMKDCEMLARITPSGGSPVAGLVTTKVTIDGSVQIFNASPYLQRHFDIEPQTGANTATATVTLFVRQSEFDNYNAANGGLPDLPANPTDAAGIANLLITQYHGTGTAPGTYTGATELIDPNDANIVWNATNNWWEITINVTGFSGFYIHSSNVFSPLPVGLLTFAGEKAGSVNKLRWTTSSEQNNKGFEVQRSLDGVNYSTIGFVNSSALNGNSSSELRYTFTDNNPSGTKQYYRLNQVDINNRGRLSTIVLIRSDRGLSLGIAGLFPNPANTQLNVLIDAPSKQRLTMMVFDVTGREVMQRAANVEQGSNTIAVDVSRLTSGTYFIKLVSESEGVLSASKFIKQ